MSLSRLPAFILATALIPLSVKGADGDNSTVKQGWSVNPVPAMAYDSDFGLMVGGFLDINYYGGLYTNYKHRICLEALTYSKHASFFMFQYDSKYLIPGLRTSAKLYYDDNPLYWFYGYNGAVHDYDPKLNTNRDAGIAYYSYNRRYLNARFELGGPVLPFMDWTAKFSYWHYWISELNWPGYDQSNTLFRWYKENGLIEEAESHGGDILEYQFGLKVDTRDIEATPTRGVFADVNMAWAPDIFKTGYDYLKLAARFRHYVSLISDRLVFAYSLAYQGVFAGYQPFYTQSYIMHFKPSDGLGGATTLRGVLYNRVMGNDYLWGNFELRTRVIDANIFKRRFFGVITPFFDAGAILEPFRFDHQAQALAARDNVSAQSFGQYRSALMNKVRELHMSAGLSMQAVIDYNFIPSVTFGIPFDERDGKYGLYMTLDYIF